MPNYDVLFEAVKIGPVTAKNRFYQVPHCCGMGHLRPQAHAAMRGMKAQGGWAVVSTEETEIHPSSDLSPAVEQRLWDERDIPALQLMTQSVHEHGALAAIELVHNGHHSSNLYSRTPALAPSSRSLDIIYPKQARAMDKADIREFRRWHKAAAIRAKQAGFDIVYVYAGHEMSLPHHFLLPEYNQRIDEYGGSLENRLRLTKELLQDTQEAIGDSCAVAFRFAVEQMLGRNGMQAHEEGRAVVEMLADIPDLWDVNVSGWGNDSATSRFQPDSGYQTEYTKFVKQVTNKPVVGVGRLTSPDMMVSLIKQGVLDFIGAARPSIADPFLPNKIQQQRIEEIRECIGCNVCVSCDNLGVPIRCTQNPTMGEEWRRGWHPEKIVAAKTPQPVLVVGAGPAGLECALQLANRGYEVILSEASKQLGGRVISESNLKGLAIWRRVSDYRIYQLQQMDNVNIYLDSALDVQQVLELGIEHVFVATGALWRKDGIGRSSRTPILGLDQVAIYTPDDIMSGVSLGPGPIVIYDDEQGYLGSVVADHLSDLGHGVSFVTSASIVSPFTELTLEQKQVQQGLVAQGVGIYTNKTIASLSQKSGHVGVELKCHYGGEDQWLACASLVLVTERESASLLYEQLQQLQEDNGASSPMPIPMSVTLIGDALAPGLIADAVFSGHQGAQEFEADPERVQQGLFKR
ncbi:MAG: FAD-dependent oxidoreductase, partial [Oceanospirillaceae bacterium]|nr:FAD-dependent oxidoreductase [Oceanospirillaceae bacterium]